MSGAHPASQDRATRPADQARSGLGDTASVPCAFKAGLVDLRITHPDCHITVEGYSDGVFGIDRRERIDFQNGRKLAVHTITHLRTGGVVRHVKGSLANAKKIAAILHKAPWDFDAPDDCKKDGREEVVEEANATSLCVPSYEVSLTADALKKIAKARGEAA